MILKYQIQIDCFNSIKRREVRGLEENALKEYLHIFYYDEFNCYLMEHPSLIVDANDLNGYVDKNSYCIPSHALEREQERFRKAKNYAV